MNILSFSEVRKGKMVSLDGEPWQVTVHQFSRKQQARPVMRTTLKNIRTGQTKEHTFSQSDKVEEADITRVPYQFLYKSGDAYSFMNKETYEQLELADGIVGDMAQFLLEGQEADVVMFEDQVVGLELPIKIDRKVIEAPPGIKGDTSTNVMKEIVIEGDVKMKAPLFVKPGDVIRIDTRTGQYVERA